MNLGGSAVSLYKEFMERKKVKVRARVMRVRVGGEGKDRVRVGPHTV